MASIRIKTSVNIENVYVTVTCPLCGKTVSMRLKGPITNKNCPKCVKVGYTFSASATKGYLSINATTTHPDYETYEYTILSQDVEIVEDEDGDEEHQYGYEE